VYPLELVGKFIRAVDLACTCRDGSGTC
jgi:hypothetical protein